ncbi:MAG: ABC transporter permease [Acidobacteria bacterium]|nr:ABC transporter permease [Acidobacteriota bacterium]
MDNLRRNFRHAARKLWRTPAFALIAILTLGLGIGANSAIFSLFDQVMLRALPVHDPQSLVILKFNNIDQGKLHSRMEGGYYFSEPMFRSLGERAQTVTLLARAPGQVAVKWGSETQQVDAELVSGNYFQVLGVRPAAGRLILPGDDEKKNGSPVVVISYAFWQKRFSGSRDVVGQTLAVSTHPFTIIGVTAPGFHSAVVGEAPSVFVPITMQPQAQPGRDDIQDWRARWLNIVGRLNSGASREKAQAELNPVWHALRADDLQRMRAQHQGPATERDRNQFLSGPLLVEPGARGLSPLRNDVGSPLGVLMAMVGLVLLIACANIATLLLARGAGRQREIAVCFALGAPRTRIVGQLLSESLLLGMAGGALGLVISPWLVSLLLRFIPPQADITPALSSDVDSRVLLFTFAVAFVTSIVAGIAPAFRFSRPDPALAMKEQSLSVAGSRSQLRRLLVASQIGLSVFLLVAAGLFTRSLLNLKNADLGFETEHLLTFEVDAKLNGYSDTAARELYGRIAAQLRESPGTSAVALARVALLNGDNWGGNITIDSYHAAPDEDLDVNMNAVSPGYFGAMKMPMVAGRDFSESDAETAPKVCIINETIANRYLGGAQQAVGHFIAMGAGDNIHPDIQIVGVARNAKYAWVKEVKPPQFMYVPNLQQPRQSSATYYVRTSLPPEQASGEIRRTVQAVDASLPVQFLETMDEHVKTNLFLQRLVAWLSLAFGGLAALLAAMGLYGLLAYSVAQRTREIGIRVALGATRGGVVKLVLRDLVVLGSVAIGVALPLSAALAQYLRSQLFGISTRDPVTYAGVVLVVAATALAAGIVPAARAARLDPLEALRTE